jgi:hypothetical protein
MLLLLEDYRRQVRQTYDAVMRAEAALESEKDPPIVGDIMQTNQRYRRARDRQRARRAAKRFSPSHPGKEGFHGFKYEAANDS